MHWFQELLSRTYYDRCRATKHHNTKASHHAWFSTFTRQFLTSFFTQLPDIPRKRVGVAAAVVAVAARTVIREMRAGLSPDFWRERDRIPRVSACPRHRETPGGPCDKTFRWRRLCAGTESAKTHKHQAGGGNGTNDERNHEMSGSRQPRLPG